jgi:hypothetical protein
MALQKADHFHQASNLENTMKFTGEVKWSLFDSIVAGVLLFGSGLLCELVIRKINTARYRLVICATVLILLVLILTELAVGIFATPLTGQ